MRPHPLWLGVVSALVVAPVVSVAFGVPSGKATRAQTRSVCGVAGGVATWSPDGKRIAFVGGAGSRHAICAADADGTHARPLRYTVCRRRCRLPLVSFSGQLDWLRPRLLLYLADFQIFKLQIGQRPQLLGKVQGGIDTFAVDARGDRVALGSSVCSNCRGPVTVLSVPTGRIVGQIGGPTADNYYPSLSPDGKRLVFTETEPQIGVWTASANGSGVQPLKQCGGTPIWSPRGDKILCSGLPAQPPQRCCSLSLVSPQGSPATTLVPRGVTPNVLGWSPNGQRVVFLTGHCSCRLAVVNVRTKKTRWPGGDGRPVSADWSPDSRQLLVTDTSTGYPNCALLWRVPANGTTPQRIRNCS
jgi:Tol biopolymer transport system component